MHKKHLTKFNTFYDKTLNKLKVEGNCLNIIKKNTHLKDPQQTSHLALKD